MAIAASYTCLTFTCLQVSPDEAQRCISGWIERVGLGRWRYERGPLDVKRIYFPEPPASSGHLTRHALWTPANRSSGSVFMIDLHDGWHGVALTVSEQTNTPAMIVCMTTPDDEYPSWSFSLYERGEMRRHVQAFLDSDAWKFHTHGDPMPFENLDYYRRRRIRDRLSREILAEYLLALGWDIGDDRFWSSEEPAIYGVQESYGDVDPYAGMEGVTITYPRSAGQK